MKNRWITKVRRAIVLFSVSVSLLYSGITTTTTYAADNEIVNETGSETVSETMLSKEHGISLYQHHSDQAGCCVLVNDILLSETEAEELISTGSLSEVALQRANLVVRESKGMWQLDTSTANIRIIPERARSFSIQQRSNRLAIDFPYQGQNISVSATIYVITAIDTTVPVPQPPTTVTNPPGGTVSLPGQTVVKPEAGYVYETYIQEPQNSIVSQAVPMDMESPEVEQTEVDIPDTGSGKPDAIMEQITTVPAGEQTETPQEPAIFKYAYVGSFGLGGMIAVISACSIYLDIKTLRWDAKKRKAERRKRLCQC